MNKMSKIGNIGTWHMLVHRKPAMFDLYITLVMVYVGNVPGLARIMT